MFARLSRRHILGSALASSSLGFTIQSPRARHPLRNATTVRKRPFDKRRGHISNRVRLNADLVEPDTKGQLVEINGQVVTRSCRPVARALLDLWHADERGEYDNAAFRYRGHLFTDGEGRYRFRTILPALYPGRTRHYHIKVQAPERPVLTTQLYFPDEPANRRDGLFRRDLVMRITEAPAGLAARFDFVLDMR